ncbi:MAG: lysophospholipid acyltransferase family protein [Pseudomonadota bacterium]
MTNILKRASVAVARVAIAFATHVVTAARPVYSDPIVDIDDGPDRPRIFFANHRSHGDFALLWSVLPRAIRSRTRPVAGADYWLTSSLKRFIGTNVFNAVLIDRNLSRSSAHPIDTMVDAVRDGASLIVFPEGTRNMGSDKLLPLKSGLHHFARALKNADLEADFVPVWIDNLNRVLPKGETVPVPLICKVHFGPPLDVQAEAGRHIFLDAARDALLALSHEDRGVKC